MIKLLCGNGMSWLYENPDGFVLTDAPKNAVSELLACVERRNGPFVNAYAKNWLTNGKFPGEKTISPYRALIRAFPAEKLIIDPFMGSGTTGIAAVLECRDFIGLEIDPKRFEYAKLRIENTLAGITSAEFCGIP